MESKNKKSKKNNNYIVTLSVPRNKEYVVREFRINVVRKTGKMWGVMNEAFIEALEIYNLMCDLGYSKEDVEYMLRVWRSVRKKENGGK